MLKKIEKHSRKTKFYTIFFCSSSLSLKSIHICRIVPTGKEKNKQERIRFHVKKLLLSLFVCFIYYGINNNNNNILAICICFFFVVVVVVGAQHDTLHAVTNTLKT